MSTEQQLLQMQEMVQVLTLRLEALDRTNSTIAVRNIELADELIFFLDGQGRPMGHTTYRGPQPQPTNYGILGGI